MNDILEIMGIGVLGILAMAAFFFVGAVLVMLAWNVIASIFGAVTIGYVQAMGVTLALCLIRGIPQGVPQIKSDK